MEEIENLVNKHLKNNAYLECKEDYLDLKNLILTSLKNKDFESFLSHFTNIQSLDAFVLIKDMISDRKREIELFKDVWSGAEIQYKRAEEFKKLFLEYRYEIMDETEKAFYDELSDKVEIYRGTRVPSFIDTGISWTTDKKIAEKFLKYPKGIFHELQLDGKDKKLCPNLITKIVSKKKIICYLNARNENEIIYW